MDWLDTGEGRKTDVVSLAQLPVAVELPVDPRARLALVEDCWRQLSDLQRLFLTAWRDNRYNATRASEQMGGKPHRKTHERWLTQVAYGTIVKAWLGVASDRALDKDRLIARQDDIVETLLTPKPVLHQGVPVMIEGKVLHEVEAGAASRANEVLLDRVMPKPSDKNNVEVNVGVAVHNGPPTLNIQVLPRPEKKQAEQGVAIDAKFTEVPSDDEWLDA